MSPLCVCLSLCVFRGGGRGYWQIEWILLNNIPPTHSPFFLGGGNGGVGRVQKRIRQNERNRKILNTQHCMQIHNAAHRLQDILSSRHPDCQLEQNHNKPQPKKPSLLLYKSKSPKQKLCTQPGSLFYIPVILSVIIYNMDRNVRSTNTSKYKRSNQNVLYMLKTKSLFAVICMLFKYSSNPNQNFV